MQRVFIDTDIILDLLAKREPYYAHAAALFSLADEGRIQVCASALCFSHLAYILRKQLNPKGAIRYLQKLKILVRILAVDEKVIELALLSGFKDFEDAIQYYTAKENGIQCLVTRNKRDYIHADIIVCTAEEYVKMALSRAV